MVSDGSTPSSGSFEWIRSNGTTLRCVREIPGGGGGWGTLVGAFSAVLAEPVFDCVSVSCDGVFPRERASREDAGHVLSRLEDAVLSAGDWTHKLLHLDGSASIEGHGVAVWGAWSEGRGCYLLTLWATGDAVGPLERAMLAVEGAVSVALAA